MPTISAAGRFVRVTPVLLALLLAAGADVGVSPARAGDTPSAGAPPRTTDNARYVPDAPLVQGMLRVRTAAAGIARIHGGVPDAAGVARETDAIRQAVNTIFAECRLDPEPDAALHPLLARLLGAVDVLAGKPGDVAAGQDIEQVIADYEQLFGPLPGATE